VLAPNPRNRLHDQHPLTIRFESKREAATASLQGAILDADPPAQGVKIARQMTAARQTSGNFILECRINVQAAN
jgi:hypothetical protein